MEALQSQLTRITLAAAYALRARIVAAVSQTVVNTQLQTTLNDLRLRQ